MYSQWASRFIQSITIEQFESLKEANLLQEAFNKDFLLRVYRNTPYTRRSCVKRDEVAFLMSQENIEPDDWPLLNEITAQNILPLFKK